MNFICCLPNCPPLLSNVYIHSSDDDLHRRSNILFEQKLTSYAKEFTRRFSFSYHQKKNSVDFDDISLGDIQDVSFSFMKKIYLSIFIYFF
jgi:hypothetical protein